MSQILESLYSLVWGVPALVLILGVGIAIFTPFLVSKQNIVQVDTYTMYMDYVQPPVQPLANWVQKGYNIPDGAAMPLCRCLTHLRRCTEVAPSVHCRCFVVI
jgi:hypothetical protein